jgi:drug/metabolite transporter (DMT)-like permease
VSVGRPGAVHDAAPVAPDPDSAPRPATRRIAWGYAMVAGAFLIMGSIGALVDYATAPESALLVVRFATAGLLLGVVFAHTGPLAGIRRPGITRLLLLMGAIDAAELLLFFIALRTTSVAIGMFLAFMAPVWVAVLAPRVFRSRTEPVVYAALPVALAGLVAILWPSLAGEGVHVSASGLVAGVAAGLLYACFQMTVKSLTNRGVGSVTIVVVESWLNVAFLLPLALWQVFGSGYALTTRDWIVGLVLGIVCTALAYTLWTEGMGRVRVQHSSILGYLEPVSAPFYAFLLLGERPGLATLVGGVLIVVAGVLVVWFGDKEELMPN